MAKCNLVISTECNFVECNSIEKSNVNNQQFRLNKINEIKNYFIADIKERELVSKRLKDCFFNLMSYSKTSKRN